jgi:hypothetical protein
LSDLPADSEATAALLRIALQARVAEKRLPEQALAEGSWSMLGAGDEAALRQQAWLKRNLPSVSGFATSRIVARFGLRRLAIPLLALPRALPGLWAGVVLTLGAAIGMAAYGWAAGGFVLVAAGALLAEFAAGLAHLRDAPFGSPGKRRLERLVPCLVDAALTASAVLAIEGGWLQRLFPPLVLLGVLQANRPSRWPKLAALLGDRGPLALIFAVAATVELAEPAVMLVALVVIALDAAAFRATSRITPT